MVSFIDIIEDIEWRKEQLLMCKTIPFLNDFSSSHREFLIKHSIPVVYSIWEGFVQSAFQTYVRELNRLSLDRRQYCNNIIVHTLETKFPQFREYPSDYNKRERFIDRLEDFLAGQFEITTIIDTESNVGFDVINKLLHKFNLQDLPHYPYKQELKSLLMHRNRISHGDSSLVINSDNTQEFIDKISEFTRLIEDLMEMILERFKIGFNMVKSYLRPI